MYAHVALHHGKDKELETSTACHMVPDKLLDWPWFPAQLGSPVWEWHLVWTRNALPHLLIQCHLAHVPDWSIWLNVSLHTDRKIFERSYVACLHCIVMHAGGFVSNACHAMPWQGKKPRTHLHCLSLTETSDQLFVANPGTPLHCNLSTEAQARSFGSPDLAAEAAEASTCGSASSSGCNAVRPLLAPSCSWMSIRCSTLSAAEARLLSLCASVSLLSFLSPWSRTRLPICLRAVRLGHDVSSSARCWELIFRVSTLVNAARSRPCSITCDCSCYSPRFCDVMRCSCTNCLRVVIVLEDRHVRPTAKFVNATTAWNIWPWSSVVPTFWSESMRC